MSIPRAEFKKVIKEFSLCQIVKIIQLVDLTDYINAFN